MGETDRRLRFAMGVTGGRGPRLRPSTPVPSTPVKAVAAALWRSQQAREDTERRAAMASDHPLDMDHRDVTERLAAAERLLSTGVQ